MTGVQTCLFRSATFDAEKDVDACLKAALAQDYPADRFEVLVADGMSMDATREIVLRKTREDARVRLIDNPTRTRAAALNAIVREGKGEIVVPMDPGADYARTHITKCVDALTSSTAEHVAIVARTVGETLVERALSAAQKTKLAFSVGRAFAKGIVDEPALLGAVRRRVFDEVGLFDPETRMEEEVELSDRIARAGYDVAVRRDIVVHKAEVRSFRELFRKHYMLGRARARRTVKERRVASPGTLTPLVMLVTGGALALSSSVKAASPVALAAYVLMTGAAAVRVGRDEGVVTIPIAWAAYPIMHLAHGVGFGSGLVRSVATMDWKAGAAPVAEPAGEPAAG